MLSFPFVHVYLFNIRCRFRIARAIAWSFNSKWYHLTKPCLSDEPWKTAILQFFYFWVHSLHYGCHCRWGPVIQSLTRIGGEIPLLFSNDPKGSFRCMNHRQSADQSPFDKPVELHRWTCGDKWLGNRPNLSTTDLHILTKWANTEEVLPWMKSMFRWQHQNLIVTSMGYICWHSGLGSKELSVTGKVTMTPWEYTWRWSPPNRSHVWFLTWPLLVADSSISPRMWLLFSILWSSTGTQIFFVNERKCTNFVSYWSLIVVVLSRFLFGLGVISQN
jgi:hypothetical protein